MRWAAALCLPLLVLGCSREVTDLQVALDLPLQGSERSVILAVEALNRGPLLFRAWAVEDGTPLAVAEAFIPEEPIVVTALLYEETLAQLGLAAGDLERSVPENVPSRELPKASRILSARVTEGVSSPFSTQSEVTGFLVDARLRETAPECVVLETRSIPLGDRHKVHFVLGVGRGALIANDASEVAYVTLEGKRPLKGPGFEIFDAFLNGTDALWLAGQGGRIFQGRLEPEGCTRVEATTPCTELRATLVGTAPHRRDLLRISGASTGTVAEVFTLSRDLRFERFHVGQPSFERLHSIPGQPGDWSCGVARVREGEAVAGCYFAGFRSVFRWKSGALTIEALPTSAEGTDPGAVTAATHVPGVGAFVGSWNGEVLRDLSGGTWQNLGARFATSRIHSLAGDERALFLLDSAGRIAQFLLEAEEGSRYCSHYSARSDTPDDPRDLTLVGRDLVAAGYPAGDATEGYVRWLVRRD